MADYIYLLESRLSAAQQRALLAVREVARQKGMTVFLVGGAVRDLTAGSPVRDLDVVVQGNALKLRKDLEKSGGVISGDNESLQTLYVQYPGNVRLEVASALDVQFPKPGKPQVKPANLLDDLRRRDFTANAMALSLNEGSYGLLMDPLNGVADIESRQFRLVSPYGFIEDPVRMVRGVRLNARLGWAFEERTQQRYETGKSEGYISAMNAFQRGYEAEEIAHEDDPLRVLRALEREGWMKQIAPAWGSAKANVNEMEKLREAQGQLQVRGIEADVSAVQFPLITAKMQPKDVKALKKSFPRQGFVKEVEALEAEGKKFAAELTSKAMTAPSAAWKLLMRARPEAILYAAYAVKSAPVQNKFKAFYTEWPQARQRIPYQTMQEMRIVPSLPIYEELVDKLFFELMDGKLTTPEETKAYLEPYSPPAPPPPVHLRRARGTKKDAKPSKSRKKAKAAVEGVDGLDEAAAAELTAALAKSMAEGGDASGGKLSALELKGSAGKKGAKAAAAPVPAKGKAAETKPVAKEPAKAVVAAKKAEPVKTAAKKAVPVKAAAKSVAKSPAKKAAKPAPKKVAAKKPSKPVAKKVAKPAAKGAKKPAAKPVKKKK
ncbi:MAG TPA: CCA tRNA nucleotidyltransferase [Acidobacteriaceae bacterium]